MTKHKKWVKHSARARRYKKPHYWQRHNLGSAFTRFPYMGKRHYGSPKQNIYVPPGWKKVEYPKDKTYVAIGIDTKGRRQYVYPEKTIEKQSRKKYRRIEELEKDFPPILQQILQGIDEGKPEAQVLYTMYKTGFRPGTEKDTLAEKPAHGAITLLSRHITIKPNDTVKFDFFGKKGVRVTKEFQDRRLAKIMKERAKGGRIFDTTAKRVRNYFDKIGGDKYYLKDLRTLKAHKVAKKAAATEGAEKKEIAEAVAKELVHTPEIAIESYISPKVLP